MPPEHSCACSQVALDEERYALLSQKLAAEAARGGKLEADLAAAAARGDDLAAESAERLAQIEGLVPALERLKASKARAFCMYTCVWRID